MTMRKWKRFLLCLCVLIVAAIGFIVWADRRGSKPSVSVSFVGYTNSVLLGGFSGVFRVTNTGPDTIYLGNVSHTLVPSDNDLGDWVTPIQGSGQNVSYGFAVLRPEEGSSVEIWVAPGFQLWSLDATFGTWGLRQQLGLWAYKSGNSTILRWAGKLNANSELTTVTLGPITNQIPTNILALPKPSNPEPTDWLP
jgi:hypothetical protein